MTNFLRFVLIGAIAALVNVGARIVFNWKFSYEAAIIMAFPVALTIAFVLNRRFVFVNAAGSASGQYARFIAINLVALIQVWVISISLARYLFPAIEFTWQAETIAHIIGVLSPVVTSYYGHQLYTFARPKVAADDYSEMRSDMDPGATLGE